MDGVIADSIRFPGAIAFASPWTRQYMFGLPGADVSRHLVVQQESRAATVTPLPNPPFRWCDRIGVALRVPIE